MKGKENKLIICDVKNYYNSTELGWKNTASFFGYSIRNHSNKKIKVFSNNGGCVVIPPLEDSHTYEYDRIEGNIQLDIHFSFKTLEDVTFKGKINYNNTVDIIISEYLEKEIDKLKKSNSRPYGYLTDIKFTIPIMELGINLDTKGCFSEILNIIICSYRSERESYVDDIPETYLLETSSKQTPSLPFLSGTFSMYQLIDNQNELESLWTMIGNDVVKINKSYNRTLSSGLYIFNDRHYDAGKSYDFYPIKSLTPERLSELGIADNRSDILNLHKTKEFIEQRKEIARLKKIINEHESVVNELERTKRLLQDMKDIEAKRKEMEKIEKRRDVKNEGVTFMGAVIKVITDLFKLSKMV